MIKRLICFIWGHKTTLKVTTGYSGDYFYGPYYKHTSTYLLDNCSRCGAKLGD